MKEKMVKKSFLGLGILFLLSVCSLPSALATSLDLTTGGDGWINGGYFYVGTENPAGTGYITPFVRLQSNDNDEEGTNTNLPRELDEKPHWLNVFTLRPDMVSNGYVQLVLDTDEPDSKADIDLTKLILYSDASDQKYPYPNQSNSTYWAGVVWDMDFGPDDDSEVLLNYALVSGGSGWWGDLFVKIPVPSEHIGKYIYVYSFFDNVDNNPEEWSIVSGRPVPEPSTTLLVGLGLVGLAGFRRKFKR